MSVYLFTALFHLLLFLLMCCTLLCGPVYASGEAPSPASVKTIELFDKNKIKDGAKGPDGRETAKQVEVKNFYSPFIVLSGDYIVALAGVNRIDVTEKTNTNIVKKFTQKNKMLNSGDDLSKIEEGWTTIFAVQTEEIQGVEKVLRSLLAVAKDNKIYLLSVNYTKKTAGDSNFNFALYFVDGAVNKAEPKEIEWKKPTLTNNTVAEQLKKKFNDQQESDFSFGGSAFLVGERIVFALNVETAEKKITALMELSDGKTELKFVDKEIVEKCHPYFFSWNKKIMMISANCQTDKNNKIMELSNIEGDWENNKEVFSFHYEFLKNKRDFVTIKNVSKEILLFTEHTGQPNVNLWMSDGTRLKNIRDIAAATEKITPVDFLFADGKLYSLNRQLGSSSSSETEGVKLKYLKEQSKEITDTINAWSNADADISRLCEQKDTFKIPCTTNGLVGFLFDTEQGSGESKWKDKYLFEDVTVKSTGSEGKTQNVSHGFEFGEDGGVKWEVGKANKDQQYSFINPGFTLVATVTINGNAGSDAFNSILGVSIKGASVEETNKIGLLCNKKKWCVYDKTKTPLIKDDKGCVVGKTYSLALVLRKQKLEIYVDGEQLTLPNEVQIKKENKIGHFYFGATSEETSDTSELKRTAVTITNVLLYNRPLEKEIEIKQLKPEQIEVDTQTPPGSDSTSQQTPKENTTKTGTQPDTSVRQTTTEKKDKQSSPPPTTEDSAVRVGCVGVLCFILFGVFTLLGRYVY